MTSKTKPTLDATSPAWLAAKADVAAARGALRSAEGGVEFREGANERHAEEVAKARRHDENVPLITSTQAAEYTGGRAVVIYPRCRNDGHLCDHDAADPPFTAADFKAARNAVTAAEGALTKAEKHLADTAPYFDAAAGAVDQDARFVWWPQNRLVDPRRFRWQGQPVTDEELAALGVHELRRLISAGAVIEVEV